MAHTPYRHGNRLEVPKVVSSPHFLYKPATPAADASVKADMAWLGSFALDYAAHYGLHASEIDVIPKSYVRDHGAQDVLNRLAQHFFADVAELADPATCAIVLCEQALPHCDDSFEGTAFLSAVVHTGPEPYILQTFHSHKKEGAYALTVNTRVLNVGDRFVLDPTTPHMAVPRHSNSDALLVLLQLEVDEGDDAERKAILKAAPPAASDANQSDVSLL